MSAFSDSDDLDLSENSVSEGLPVLRTGVYDVVSSHTEKGDTTKGKKLTVTFTDEGGRGQIRFIFNYINAGEDAQRIGRDQLKTFLTHGKHPNPNKPFSLPLNAMDGLRVRVFVDQDGTYVKNNKTLDSYRITRFMPIDPAIPAAGPTGASASRSSSSSSSASSGGAASLDDDIPF